jgi:hypothetical protein
MLSETEHAELLRADPVDCALRKSTIRPGAAAQHFIAEAARDA